MLNMEAPQAYDLDYMNHILDLLNELKRYIFLMYCMKGVLRPLKQPMQLLMHNKLSLL